MTHRVAIEVSAKRVSSESELFAVCFDWIIPGDSKMFETREAALADALRIVKDSHFTDSNQSCFVYRP